MTATTAASTQVTGRFPVYLDHWREIKPDEDFIQPLTDLARTILREKPKQLKVFEDGLKKAVNEENVHSIEQLLSSQFFIRTISSDARESLKIQLRSDRCQQREEALLREMYPSGLYTYEQRQEIIKRVTKEFYIERDQEDWDIAMKNIGFYEVPFMYFLYGIEESAEKISDLSARVSTFVKNDPKKATLVGVGSLVAAGVFFFSRLK